jgi:hypothetical protein
MTAVLERESLGMLQRLGISCAAEHDRRFGLTFSDLVLILFLWLMEHAAGSIFDIVGSISGTAIAPSGWVTKACG